MALALMPDGTFKKLSKIQTDALDRYYKREKKVTKEFSTEAGLLLVGYGVPTVMVATIAAAVFIFRDEIKKETLTRLEKGAIISGLGVAKVITRFFRGEKQKTEPMTPDSIPSQLDPEVMVEIPRCTRYEADYVNQNTIAEGIPFGVGTILQALAQLHTIESMKLEGCSKPDIIPQSQWEQG